MKLFTCPCTPAVLIIMENLNCVFDCPFCLHCNRFILTAHVDIYTALKDNDFRAQKY